MKIRALDLDKHNDGDHPDIQETFKEFKTRPVRLKYSVRKDTWTEGKKLLVSNF